MRSKYLKLRLPAAAVLLVVGAVAIVAVFGPGSASSTHAPGSGLVADGAAVYAEHCQVCHGAVGHGGTGPALAGDLDERYPDVNAQRAVILTGPKSMPSFAGRLTEHEIDAVIAFTRTGL